MKADNTKLPSKARSNTSRRTPGDQYVPRSHSKTTSRCTSVGSKDNLNEHIS